MNKTELLNKVAADAGVSKADTNRVWDAVVAAITVTLKQGDTVTIPGFGTFKVADRAARTGRNPQTGKAIQIAAQKTPRFSAGKQLKDAVNNRDN